MEKGKVFIGAYSSNNMRINLLVILLISVCLINFSSATLSPVKQNDCKDIPMTLNTSSITIGNIYYPNSSIAVSNVAMTKNGNSFNYTFCSTKDLGIYTYDFCDADGNCWTNDFEVTGNGKYRPEGIIIVLFSLLFLIVIGFLIYELILSIGHFASLDLDVVDLAKSFGVYFALFALYGLEQFYLGNPNIASWIELILKIGGFTHILIPLVGFLISITVGSLKKRRVDFGVNRIYRGGNNYGKV